MARRKKSANTKSGSIEDELDAIAADVASLGNTIGDVASTEAREMIQSIRQRLDAMAGVAGDTTRQGVGMMEDTIRDRPVFSVLMAFALGFDAIEHDHMVDQGIEDRRIEAQRPRANRFEPRRGVGVAAGEEGHVMATANQLLREVRNHSLRSVIKAGRTGFMQRSNLRNSHNPRFLLMDVPPALLAHPCVL